MKALLKGILEAYHQEMFEAMLKKMLEANLKDTLEAKEMEIQCAKIEKVRICA